ncbi:uncharacterized protein BCR38DRAFT_452911 [Pseudomassariella vexata]|uniref:Uncharacterized protein n=1 Tax=Pseudomassariella vexata TaxID=1141098 RepID=A0A1Y2D772_9PEZI|nr:uncharacterized protein BCR38DRAFT_452911 [Pseudomassariella vexata]ORY55123.1 hypothetical protein BCR38DRAFT_452911 [Pseudomassariella vexata]
MLIILEPVHLPIVRHRLFVMLGDEGESECHITGTLLCHLQSYVRKMGILRNQSWNEYLQQSNTWQSRSVSLLLRAFPIRIGSLRATLPWYLPHLVVLGGTEDIQLLQPW